MAAGKGYAVLDIQNNSEDLTMDLQFQDFGDTRTQQTITFTDFPESMEEQEEEEKQDDDDKTQNQQPSDSNNKSPLSFAYYQRFFDVESKQVSDRILWSMVPKPGLNYLHNYIRPNPDLYGPFWISITLAFTTAITGNLSNYLTTRPGDTHVWRYDFNKVTLAASAIFTYAWLVPLAVWGVVLWSGSRARITLLELVCIYGYSLAIFVPVSILWMIPQPWLQWCLAILSPVLSGGVLVRTLWPSLAHTDTHTHAHKVAFVVATFILLLHATLALGFMLYFFQPPATKINNNINNNNINNNLETTLGAKVGENGEKLGGTGETVGGKVETEGKTGGNGKTDGGKSETGEKPGGKEGEKDVGKVEKREENVETGRNGEKVGKTERGVTIGGKLEKVGKKVENGEKQVGKVEKEGETGKKQVGNGEKKVGIGEKMEKVGESHGENKS